MDKEKFTKEFKKILGEKRMKNLIAVCIILCFILIAMNVFSSETIKFNDKKLSTNSNNTEVIDNKTTTQEEKSYEEKQKDDLKNILKKMNGVGDVEVMIAFENAGEKVPAYDKNTQKSKTEENDTEGGKRVTNQDTDSSKTVMTTNDGDNEPFILTTYTPKINGVIILAEGAGSSKTKYEIQQAVSKLYNLSLDKVNVYSMKK